MKFSDILETKNGIQERVIYPFTYTYTPSYDLYSGGGSDKSKILQDLSSDITKKVKSWLRRGDDRKKIFLPYVKFNFKYDNQRQRCYYENLFIQSDHANYKNIDMEDSPLTMQFKPGIANVLGFTPNKDYSLKKLTGQSRIYGENKYNNGKDLNTLFVYSDVCVMSPFANDKTNILAAFSVSNHVTQNGFNPFLYKKVRNNSIEDISIVITDSEGDRVRFENPVIVVLHFKPL